MELCRECSASESGPSRHDLVVLVTRRVTEPTVSRGEDETVGEGHGVGGEDDQGRQVEVEGRSCPSLQWSPKKVGSG